MLAPTQNLQDLPIKALTLPALDRSFPLTDITQSIPQLSDNADSLQTPISEPIAPPSYSESDYDWLVDVLDTLIKFVRRDEDWSVPGLRKNDYDWAHAMLVELVGAVGESVTHPLRPSMEFVSRLVANYEDKYVPQLTELFPELIEEKTTEISAITSSLSTVDSLELNEDKLAANAFFSIGCLLLAGEKLEKALTAYDTAIFLTSDYAEAYHHRGVMKTLLGQHEAAIADYSDAIRLNRDYAIAYFNRGCAKNALWLYESAILDFNETLCLNPDSAGAYYNRGVARSMLKQYEIAISDYDKAIGINANYAEAHANRGDAKVNLNSIDEARLDFQKALELAEQQGNNNLKVFVEEHLQELNNSTPQDSEN